MILDNIVIVAFQPFGKLEMQSAYANDSLFTAQGYCRVLIEFFLYACFFSRF